MTENGQRLLPGDGFWRTATGKGTYRLFVADTRAGQVAFIGSMREANIPVVAAIRLKVTNRQVSEIELFVLRDMTAANALDMMGKPNSVFGETIPAADHATREDLVKVANLYYAGLEKNDGKGVYPFTDDCNRIQNGVQTTNSPDYRPPAPPGAGRGAKGKQAPPPPPVEEPLVNTVAMSCKAGFESGYFHFVNKIRDRRFVAVDPERGLVFAFVMMDLPSGKYQHFKLADGRDITAGPKRPQSLEAVEMFRIEKGKIRQVEAVQDEVPYGMLSGWSN